MKAVRSFDPSRNNHVPEDLIFLHENFVFVYIRGKALSFTGVGRPIGVQEV
jgi:hypothetical protein